jgi:tetratricopeptide (TPR) repeat protein
MPGVFAICIAIAFTQLGVNAVRAAEDHTQTLQSLLAEAREAQSRKDFPGAAESYRKAVQLNPSDEDGSVHYQLGRVYQKQGDRNAA